MNATYKSFHLLTSTCDFTDYNNITCWVKKENFWDRSATFALDRRDEDDEEW
jgi:hypothetical protein